MKGREIMQHCKEVVLTPVIFFLLIINSGGQTRAEGGIAIDSAKYIPAPLSSPTFINYIADYEKILDSASIKILTELIKEHEHKTSDEIAILTIPTYMPYNNLGDYTRDVSNYLGIGKKTKNNGVIIVLSTTKGALRIGTGLGLVNKLTDAMCQKVIDEQMIPKIKIGDYSGGLIDGVKELIRLLGTE